MNILVPDRVPQSERVIIPVLCHPRVFNQTATEWLRKVAGTWAWKTTYNRPSAYAEAEGDRNLIRLVRVSRPDQVQGLPMGGLMLVLDGAHADTFSLLEARGYSEITPEELP